MRSGPVTAIEAFAVTNTGRKLPGVERAPAGLAGNAILVSDPANVRSAVTKHAGVGDGFDDIALPVFPRGILYRMFGELRRPEAETVVMLAGQNQLLHACVTGGAGDLVGIEIGWIEDLFIFAAVAPFLIGKGI